MGKVKASYIKEESYKKEDVNGVYETPLFQKFQLLKSKWLQETRFHSNTELIYSNKYYQQIIQLGPEVAPYIIEDLKKERNNWFQALAQILNVNPVKPEHYGNLDAMINDWIIWHKQNLAIS